MASYSAGDMQPPDSDDNPDYSESPESPPDPWYRNRLLVAVWATMVAILVVLIIYGLIQLSRGSAGGPSITTPSTTPAPSSPPTRSSTPTPSTTTTTPPPPPTSEEQQPPGGYSEPPPQSPSPPPHPVDYPVAAHRDYAAARFLRGAAPGSVAKRERAPLGSAPATGYGPPDDPSEAPTRQDHYGDY